MHQLKYASICIRRKKSPTDVIAAFQAELLKGKQKINMRLDELGEFYS